MAMPMILTTPAEIEAWMTAPAEEALKLQRPLPDGALEIVAGASGRSRHLGLEANLLKARGTLPICPRRHLLTCPQYQIDRVFSHHIN
jgi:hypothetical protein